MADLAESREDEAEAEEVVGGWAPQAENFRAAPRGTLCTSTSLGLLLGL